MQQSFIIAPAFNVDKRSTVLYAGIVHEYWLHFFFSCLPRCPIEMCLEKPRHILTLLLTTHIWWARNYAHCERVMGITKLFYSLLFIHNVHKHLLSVPLHTSNVSANHPSFVGKNYESDWFHCLPQTLVRRTLLKFYVIYSLLGAHPLPHMYFNTRELLQF
jgi:hypothetical protein